MMATPVARHPGILTALYERERTGVGGTLDVALIDAFGEWMTQPNYHSVYGQEPARRTGAQHASIAPHWPYQAGEGSTVHLSVRNDREWAVPGGASKALIPPITVRGRKPLMRDVPALGQDTVAIGSEFAWPLVAAEDDDVGEVRT